MYLADETISDKVAKEIAKKATANFKELGLKSKVKVLKGKLDKVMYERLDKTDALAVIGGRNAVIKTVSSVNEKAGKEISKFGRKGNPEQSQNPKGDQVQTEGNIIAISTEATKDFAENAGATFNEAAAFLINHGAGHNAGLNHAGDHNGFDDQGKYQVGGVWVPFSPNVMSEGSTLTYEKKGLQRFISSPVNQQDADKKNSNWN